MELFRFILNFGRSALVFRKIWLKPDVMAQYNLMPSDVAAALAEQNIEAAPGAFGEQGDQSFQYTLRYKGRLSKSEEFEDIVVRANANGEVLRLGDVAKVELGRVTYGFDNSLNGHPATSAIVFQTAGSNATQIIEDCLNVIDQMKADLPQGAITAIEHLASEVKRIGVLYNQFVAAYNKAILLTDRDGNPVVTVKETQRNQLGLMDLTMEMTDKVHSLMDYFGVSHNRARTSGEQPKENSKTPDRGTVIIPKL